jgi:hypothetical protein
MLLADRAYLIPPVGSVERVREVMPANGTDFQLDEMYRLLGCEMIQIVPLRDGRLLVMDEEGKCHDQPKPFNALATGVAIGSLMEDDWVSGPALLCGENQIR